MSEESRSLREFDLARPAPASAAARARARQAFLHGEIRPARRRFARPLISAIAAAAALVIWWFGQMPSEPWTLSAASGSWGLDGQAVAVGQTLDAGRVVTGSDSELEFALGDRLLLRVRTNSDLQLPKPPGRWWGRRCDIELERGEIYGSSPGALGFDLHLRTDEAHARVVGTTFAMFRREGATCYCLYDGHLEVRDRHGALVALPVGKRVFIYPDEREPSLQDLPADENMKLQMIHDTVHGP